MSESVDLRLPTLLPYQRRWVLDRSQVKVAVKSRRIGLTWATAYEAVEVAAASREHGGSDFWYQVYAEDDAKEFIADVEMWARAVGVACSGPTTELVEGDQAQEEFLLPEGQQSVRITSIRFTSGFRVSALPATPRKLRGKDGVYCLDEADYHDNLTAALEAGSAFLMWGGRLMIISTMGDVDGGFNRLVQDVKGGDPRNVRSSYSLHEITLPEAVREGLYKRICQVQGKPWSPTAERDWLDYLLSTEGADCEFLCIPRRSGGQYLPRSLVEPCTSPDCVVRRFHAQPGFLQRDEADRDKEVDDWLHLEVAPVLERLPDMPHFLGEDFGRKADLTVMAVGHLCRDMSLRVPLMLELGNVPYESQKRVLYWLAARLPKLSRMTFDATGNGAYLAEQALARWGAQVVESVNMSQKWYGEQLPRLKARFSPRAIELPQDLDTILDLGKFEVCNGVPMLPKHRVNARARGESGRSLQRHGDAGVALACLSAAASAPVVAYRYEPTGKRAGDFAMDGLW